MSTAAGSSDDDDFEQISFGQPQPPMPPPKPRQPKAKSQSAIAKAAKSSAAPATQSSTQGTQGGGTQGGGTQGGGTQGRTKMPPSTTAAIVSLAQAGKSLVGIRRGLIEGDHRNSVGKLFPATGKDFNVILRTLKANGIKEPDEDHESDFADGVKPRHAKRTGGPPGGTAKPAKPSGAKPAASAVDGTSLGRESLGLRGSAAAVVYNDAARFSQLMKQDGAVSQSQARPAASVGGPTAKRSTSASQGGGKKPAYRAPLLPASSQPSAQPSATARRATASQAEPRKPKRARLAEEAAQSGCQGVKVRHPITGSFSRFDPSLSYKSLCSQIKDAFELDASCGLRFTYEDDEGDRCSVTTEPEWRHAVASFVPILPAVAIPSSAPSAAGGDSLPGSANTTELAPAPALAPAPVKPSTTLKLACTVLPGAGGGDSKRKKGNSAPAAPPPEEHAQGTGGTGLGLVAELEE